MCAFDGPRLRVAHKNLAQLMLVKEKVFRQPVHLVTKCQCKVRQVAGTI